MLADVLGDLAVGGQRRGEHEPDVVLDHHVAGPVADLGLEAAERDRREAPQGAVVGGRLAGVADPELDVVDALERQEVGGLGVGVRVDPGARLVGGAARDGLGHRSSPLLSAGGRVGRRPGATDGLASNATPRVRHWRAWTTTCSTDCTRDGRPGGDAARRVEAAAPWPLAGHASTPPRRRAWGPPEVLAHVAEMVPFWLGEMERILAGEPEPVLRSGGSSTTRPARGPRARPLAAAARSCTTGRSRSLERFERRLATLTPEDLGRRGLHPRLGEMTVAAIVGPLRGLATWPSTSVQLETILARRRRRGPDPAVFILYAIPIGIVVGYLLGGRLERLGDAAAPLGRRSRCSGW